MIKSSILLLIIMTLTCHSYSALAASSRWAVQQDKQGFIIGGQLGAVSQEAPEGAALKHSLLSAILPFAGRAYAGYQFNNYLALELGYALFEDDNSPGDATFGPDHYKLSAIDLAAKLIMPVNNYINVFVKPGIARVHQDVFNQYLRSDTTPLIDSNVNKVVPEIGGGIGLELIRNVAMDVSYNHIFGSGIVGATDFAAVGLTLRFN